MVTAEELTAKIEAQGEQVRSLKGSGAAKDAVAKEVEALLKLKDEFKALTGAVYGPAKKAKKPKLESKSNGQEGKKDGPSKSALKKQAKMLASKEKKEAKARGDVPTTVAEAFTAAPPAPPSGLSLFCSTKADLLKCLAAAEYCGTGVHGIEYINGNPCPSHPLVKAGGIPSGTVLQAEGNTIVGANAVCRYLGYISKSSSAKADCSTVAVDQLIEWEATVLSKALAEASELSSTLTDLEAQMTSDYMTGDSPCLADIVLLPTLEAALAANTGAATPKLTGFVARTKGASCVVKALDQLELAFTAMHEAPTAGEGGFIAALSGLFMKAVLKVVPEAKELGFKDEDAGVVLCKQYKFGDFQNNSAMLLMNLLRGNSKYSFKSPRELSAAIAAALPASPLIDSTSLAGAGYVNIRLRTSVIAHYIDTIISDGPQPPVAKPLKIAIDFSSPNIAKEMHVGHLRSTIIGDTLARIMEFCGHQVLRINHVGDWGTQFGMLINYMKEAYPNFLTDPPNITDLTGFYKAAKKRFDESDDFKHTARNTVVDLQRGDEHCKKVWSVLCDISRKEFQKVYDRLDVKLGECGESFYNSRIPAVVDEMESKGILMLREGAMMCELDGFTFPLIVKKSDGGFGYDSTDMTALSYRLRELGCDWNIYVTDDGQREHFEMCFKAAEACGWCSETTRLEHVGFGVVQGDDGKKFKTRSGETVRLVDLLDEAVTRMEAILMERFAEGKTPLSEGELHKVAAQIGYGAVKYFDLRQHPGTAYQFSYDRMLDTRGNTAVYLEYAHARLSSIIRKAEAAGADMKKIVANRTPPSLDADAERALAFQLMQFTDVVAASLDCLIPTRICEYLYDVSNKFSDFVTKCKVIGSPEQDGRLVLCEATGSVMRKCFELLGIVPLYQI